MKYLAAGSAVILAACASPTPPPEPDMGRLVPINKTLPPGFAYKASGTNADAVSTSVKSKGAGNGK